MEEGRKGRRRKRMKLGKIWLHGEVVRDGGYPMVIASEHWQVKPRPSVQFLATAGFTLPLLS